MELGVVFVIGVLALTAAGLFVYIHITPRVAERGGAGA